jgi:hypothetical protein
MVVRHLADFPFLCSRSRYSLGTRAMVELEPWLKSTFGEAEDDEEDEGYLKECIQCSRLLLQVSLISPLYASRCSFPHARASNAPVATVPSTSTSSATNASSPPTATSAKTARPRGGHRNPRRSGKTPCLDGKTTMRPVEGGRRESRVRSIVGGMGRMMNSSQRMGTTARDRASLSLWIWRVRRKRKRRSGRRDRGVGR